MSQKSLTPGMIGLGLFLCAGLVGFSYLAGRAVIKSVPSNQIVKVRGVADLTLDLDRINWSIKVTHRDSKLKSAYERVDRDMKLVKEFLKRHGVEDSAVAITGYTQAAETKSIVKDKFGNRETRFVGYRVERWAKLEDYQDLKKVEGMIRAFSSEVKRYAPEVSSTTPFYYYSKPVRDVKPKLLEQAAQNAFQRATTIATSSGSVLGALRAARQGVFEGFGSGGHVGGSTPKHRITAIVTVDYAIGM